MQLGNIDIHRDWGWAPEYVEAMWTMLQQEEPEDFVVATGKTYSLRDFIKEFFSCLDLDWQEHVEFDQGLKRPTDIEISRADPSKAEKILGWKASFTMPEVAIMMVESEKNQKNN